MVRDSQNCGVDSRFVLIEDLDDVPVGLRIKDLAHVAAGRHNAATGEEISTALISVAEHIEVVT
jgi:hypothetical protein